ncbi:MAG: subtype I-B CRISPR-associated endonuclease Cas1, partial [Candidatus Kapaibacterium sp.]
TIKHRKLNKHVSYRLLIRLELYKLLKDIMKIEEYKALKMWW